MVQPLTIIARPIATLLPVKGFVPSLVSWIHMPLNGLLLHAGTRVGSVGKPPVFGPIPRMGYAASPAYLQASSLLHQAPLLLPDAKTRFWSKQSSVASRSHTFS